MRSSKIMFFFLCLVSLIPTNVPGWGFFAHKYINRLAVFSLPPDMLGFYKKNIDYLTTHAVDPDKRRYVNDREAPRHYIDIDVYGDSAIYRMPHYWPKAVEIYSEDTLQAYGIVPWHVDKLRMQLTVAFAEKNKAEILRYSADLGHYLADANVPLHTTKNYNGQLTGQEGIHGLWESRLPELYSSNYSLFVGKATYLKHPSSRVWQALIQAHEAKDSVLVFEIEVTRSFDADKKYSYAQKGASFQKVYTEEFCKKYHEALSGQVERQMRASIKLIADVWYTCWVDAGQPDLSEL